MGYTFMALIAGLDSLRAPCQLINVSLNDCHTRAIIL